MQKWHKVQNGRKRRKDMGRNYEDESGMIYDLPPFKHTKAKDTQNAY